MPLLQREEYTVEDIYNLPEGTRAELIDGQIYYIAPPTRTHQDIVGTLYRKIADYINAKGGSCKTYISPFAVFLNKNDKNYVEPDISVICNPDKLNDRGCNGAPDWIVDPIKNLILVYNFETNDSEQYTFADTIKVGIYEDLFIDFSQISL